MTAVTGIILVGGSSRRMGRDKASLMIGGETLAQRTTCAVAHVADEIVIVHAPEEPPPRVSCNRPVFQVADAVADGGPAIGLLAGLDAARHEAALVAGVDLPFLRPDLLRLLVSRLNDLRASGIEWVVPVADGYLQPLCSAFVRDAREALRTRLAAGDRALVDFEAYVATARLEEEEWRQVDPDGLSFIDVDTPEAYAAALARYERLRAG